MAERKQTSRRLVNRRVVGSANPVAKYGRDSKRTCLDTIGGFFLGLLLFFIPFGLTYCAGTQEKDSKDISKLEVRSAESVAGFTGKALVAVPQLTLGDKLEPPIGDSEANLIAYDYKFEKWETWTETHQETETRVENGQEVEYTYDVEEEVSDWKIQDQDKRWARLAVGDINIDPQKCNVQLEWTQSFKDEYTDASTGEKYRETVHVIRAAPNMLLAAEFDNGQVADDPDFYILTPHDKDALVAKLDVSEENTRKFKLVLAVILMWISLNLIIGPAMLMINLIPIKQLTGAIRFVVGIIALILSIIIVAVTYFFVRYWWIIILLLLGLAVWIVIEANRNRNAEPDLEPALEEE
jgi:hypothetical protein